MGRPALVKGEGTATARRIDKGGGSLLVRPSYTEQPSDLLLGSSMGAACSAVLPDFRFCRWCASFRDVPWGPEDAPHPDPDGRSYIELVLSGTEGWACEYGCAKRRLWYICQGISPPACRAIEQTDQVLSYYSGPRS